MKIKGSLLIIGLSVILTACAATVPIEVTKLPAIDTSGIERVAVEPFTSRVSGRAAGETAADLTQTLSEVVINAGRFTLVDFAQLERMSRAARSNAVDALISGEITRYAVDDETREDKRRDTQTKKDYTVIQFSRTATVDFTYRVTRNRDGSVIGQVNRSVNASSGWADDPFSLTSGRDLARTAIANERSVMVRDIAPWKMTISKALEKDKSKDPRMKEADKQVKAKNYRLALDIYNEVYKDTGNFAAGYNAAIFTEALGSLEDAIAAMSQVASQTGNPKALAELSSMRATLTENRTLAEKFSETGGPSQTAARKAARDLAAKLSAGAILSILNATTLEKDLTEYVVEEMVTEILTGGRLTVVERKDVGLIQAEQVFQLSGDVDDASAVSVGKMLGADFIVTVQITGQGSLRRLRVKALDVETGALAYQLSQEI